MEVIRRPRRMMILLSRMIPIPVSGIRRVIVPYVVSACCWRRNPPRTGARLFCPFSLDHDLYRVSRHPPLHVRSPFPPRSLASTLQPKKRTSTTGFTGEYTSPIYLCDRQASSPKIVLIFRSSRSQTIWPLRHRGLLFQLKCMDCTSQLLSDDDIYYMVFTPPEYTHHMMEGRKSINWLRTTHVVLRVLYLHVWQPVTYAIYLTLCDAILSFTCSACSMGVVGMEFYRMRTVGIS